MSSQNYIYIYIYELLSMNGDYSELEKLFLLSILIVPKKGNVPGNPPGQVVDKLCCIHRGPTPHTACASHVAGGGPGG
jgi:hypothetical protein